MINLVKLILNLEKLVVNGIAEKEDGAYEGDVNYTVPYFTQKLEIEVEIDNWENNTFKISPVLRNGKLETPINLDYAIGLVDEVIETL